MRSMTGFGRGRVDLEGDRISFSVQGWNHRHADLALRLSEDLRPFEAQLRSLAMEHLHRGRCEIAARWTRGVPPGAQRAVDRVAVRRFLDETAELVESGELDGRWSRGDLSRSPFLVPAAPPEDEEPGEPLRSALRTGLAEALEAFDRSREDEGRRIAGLLATGLERLGDLVAEIEDRRASALDHARTRLAERLAEILPGGSDALPPERLAQEVVLLADRADLSEELDRLRGHLEGFAGALHAAGPHGRRLEFLLQEILRELNTLGAKSRELEIIRLVVEAKVLHEQLREQVQNVE